MGPSTLRFISRGSPFILGVILHIELLVARACRRHSYLACACLFVHYVFKLCPQSLDGAKLITYLRMSEENYRLCTSQAFRISAYRSYTLQASVELVQVLENFLKVLNPRISFYFASIRALPRAVHTNSIS